MGVLFWSELVFPTQVEPFPSLTIRPVWTVSVLVSAPVATTGLPEGRQTHCASAAGPDAA